ncbi:MAG: peptidoglycan DD-metalloendopeptidase family protein [Gammaproteobacteria bacterium]|nr:peptidoglycan DD-metalloendopeptidase family protein [Gammaproteobacteria bacterium]MYF37756.1 peptidoglycan DD-metalloendopeptidase family protein [Gammaproteobacteria bacterium]
MRFRLFVAVGVFLVNGWCAYAALPSIAEYKQQLGRVIDELNRHEEWIETANEQILQIEANIKNSDREISAVTKEVSDLESNIGQIEERIDVLKIDQEVYQQKISELNDSVSWHLHAEYRLQKNHWLKNLLDYDEPKKRTRLTRYHQFFVRSKSSLLEEFNAAMGHLNQTSRELYQERSRLDHERDIANVSKERLNEQVAQREVQIANLEAEIHNSEVRVEKLTMDQQRIRKLIIQIDALGLDVPSEFTVTDGSLTYPVDGEIVRKFGDSRADGRLNWNGVVFSAKANSDVVAVAAGRVVMADWLQGYGMIVIIDHGDDVKTIYANCNSLLVESGDFAEAGEVIAKTGQSGGSTIPGLYFEVLKDGNQVNPIQWLEAQDETE